MQRAPHRRSPSRNLFALQLCVRETQPESRSIAVRLSLAGLCRCASDAVRIVAVIVRATTAIATNTRIALAVTSRLSSHGTAVRELFAHRCTVAGIQRDTKTRKDSIEGIHLISHADLHGLRRTKHEPLAKLFVHLRLACLPPFGDCLFEHIAEHGY